MIASLLDLRMVRFGLAAIGLPLTAAALVGLIYTAIFLVSGVQQGEWVLIGMGSLGVLGAFGLAGAWWRILRARTAMSNLERVVIRTLLTCGIASGMTMSAWAMHAGGAAVALFFGSLALFGAVLFWGTPVAV